MSARSELDRLMSAEEVAAFLNVPVATLYQWRHHGVGPRGMRVGRHLRYRRQELEAWLDTRTAPSRDYQE